MTVVVHPVMLPTPGSPVLIHYRDANGTPQFTTPDAAALIALERGKPVRDIPRYKGQSHTPGLYWCATDGQQHEYESYLESRWMTLFDFDPRVVAMRAQPFRIQCLDARGSWEHTPDLFLRYDDGSGRVIDVKNPARVNDTGVLVQAARTREICDRIGFGYSLLSEPEHIPWLNVQWLAGYRRPFQLPAALTDRILHLAARPTPIGTLTAAFDIPELARTAVLRACWFGQLVFDLHAPLRDFTLVHTKEGP